MSGEVERAADVMRQLLREGLEAGGHFVPNAQLIITQEEIVLTDANQQHKVKINLKIFINSYFLFSQKSGPF